MWATRHGGAAGRYGEQAWWGAGAADPEYWVCDRAVSDAAEPADEYVGTSGRDRIKGTFLADSIDVSQGGNDSIACHEGDDTIYFGAAFTFHDKVNGGAGHDTVILDGDYSAGLEITARCLHSIDSLELHGGSYVITGTLGFKGTLGFAYIDAHGLKEGQTLNLSVASSAPLVVSGGLGDDVIRAASNGVDSSLSGNEGDDWLIGNSASYMLGDIGADRIVMVGAGDIAVYAATEQSTRGSVDRIDSFAASSGRIELTFDSDTTTVKRDLDFHLGRTAERVGDIVSHYDAAHDFTVVKVFTDHDNQADLIVHLTGDVPLTPADFIFG